MAKVTRVRMNQEGNRNFVVISIVVLKRSAAHDRVLIENKNTLLRVRLICSDR